MQFHRPAKLKLKRNEHLSFEVRVFIVENERSSSAGRLSFGRGFLYLKKNCSERISH
jgi:hypothetical protein